MAFFFLNVSPSSPCSSFLSPTLFTWVCNFLSACALFRCCVFYSPSLWAHSFTSNSFFSPNCQWFLAPVVFFFFTDSDHPNRRLAARASLITLVCLVWSHSRRDVVCFYWSILVIADEARHITINMVARCFSSARHFCFWNYSSCGLWSRLSFGALELTIAFTNFFPPFLSDLNETLHAGPSAFAFIRSCWLCFWSLLNFHIYPSLNNLPYVHGYR